MVYLIVIDMDISYMRASYAPVSPRETTNNPLLDGMIDSEEMDVTYPVDPLTGNRQSVVVRALNARTPPALRNQLMASVETLPPDRELDKHLTDDDKLDVLKPRYCQTRQEIQSYVDFMNNMVNNELADSDSVSLERPEPSVPNDGPASSTESPETPKTV